MAKITNFFNTAIVKNQKIDLEIPIVPFAFDGSRNYTIKLRTGSFSGPLLYQPPVITVVDNARIIDFSPSAFSTVEGRDLDFYLLTANVADGSVIYYSVDPVSNNISLTEDFTFTSPNIDITGNVIGNVILNYFNLRELVINNNQATITIQTDINSNIGSDDKIFRVGLYSFSNVLSFVAAEPEANVANTRFSFTTSPNVAIKDTTNFYNIVTSSFNIDHTQSITFTVNTVGVENGTNLYYFTTGTPTANTGIVSVTSNVATITFKPELPFDTSTNFDVKLRLGDQNGPLLAASPPVVGTGEKMRFMEMTGGDKFTLGNFTYHVFRSAGTLTVNKVGTIYNQVTISAVGGGGGGDVGFSVWTANGGRGGRVQNIVRTFSQSDRNKVATVTVGSGGVGAFYSPTSSSGGSSGTPTSINFSDSPSISVTAAGGFLGNPVPASEFHGAGGAYTPVRQYYSSSIDLYTTPPGPSTTFGVPSPSGYTPVASYPFPGTVGGPGVPISPNFSPSEFTGAPPQVNTILNGTPSPMGSNGPINSFTQYGGGGGTGGDFKSPYNVPIVQYYTSFPATNITTLSISQNIGGGNGGGGGVTSVPWASYMFSSSGGPGSFGGGGGGTAGWTPSAPAPSGIYGGAGGAGFVILKYRSND